MLIVVGVSQTAALSWRPGKLPAIPDLGEPGMNGNQCNTCHTSGGGTARNPFGLAWEAAYPTFGDFGLSADDAFAAVASLDSDGDGFTNAEELDARAHPGNALSQPAPQNSAPVAEDVTFAAVEDTAATIALVASDTDGDSLTYAIVAAAQHGATETDGANAIYTPVPNFHGVDSFSYSVTLTVAAVNDPAVGTPTEALTFQNIAVDITLAAVDIESDDLTYFVVSPPAGGLIEPTSGDLMDGEVTVTYIPTLDFVGSDTFTFAVNDGTDDSDAVEVTVEVIPNAAPVVRVEVGFELTMIQGTEIVIPLEIVDTDSSAFTGKIVTAASGGVATLAANALSVTYVPDSMFVGQDGFSVSVKDAEGAVSAPLAVFIEVTVPNLPPTAGPAGPFSTLVDTPTIVVLVGADPEGRELTYDIVAPPASGSLTGDGSSRVYTPQQGFIGADSFIYLVSDGFNISDAATVQITVDPAIAVTAPARDAVYPSGTTSIPLIVETTSNSADHWHWSLDTPYPQSGVAGGTPVFDGSSTTIAGLHDGETHVVYVVAADADHQIRGPQDSATFTISGGAPAVEFSLRNSWIVEPTVATRNGVADAGERILPRVRLRNDGPGEAQNVVVTLTSTDPDVIVVTGQVAHDAWTTGSVDNNKGFILDIAGNASTHDATLTVSVTADNGGPWQFQVTIPVVGNPPVSFAQRSSWIRDQVTGDADRLAEPGERVEIRTRLVHDGGTDAQNVTVTLSTSDENVGVSSATVNHATWTVGQARNNVGLVVDLGEGVGASVDFVLTVTADNGGPWQFSFTVAVALPTAPAAVLAREDIDLDGVVGIRDILMVATVYGQHASTLPAADLNGDRHLDMADMIIIHATRADVLDGAQSSRHSPVALAERWLRDSRQSNDGSMPFRRGIAALYGILAALRPAGTALLPNYPNPFNPDTWIPFNLSQTADVVVRVYDMQGRAVRRIALGSLNAGSYRSRDAAAYWDGRNDLGESVASGAYLYELRAGDFVARRRMVVRK
jgi:hypothetical protein